MKRSLTLTLALMFLLSAADVESGRADAGSWPAVAGPYGGSVAALALSPSYTSDHTVFAGVRGRGIYRTTDGGLSWQLTSPADWPVVDVAISPAYATDHTLFAAFGFWTGSYSVYRSTDGGNTWQAPSTSPYSYGFPGVSRLAVSPNFAVDHTLYAIGVEEYWSTDAGVTFATLDGWFIDHEVIDLAFSPAYATDQTLFAWARNEGIFKSIDGGATWNPTTLTGTAGALAVSPNYAVDHTLIATNVDDGYVHISIDGGASWTPTTLTLPGLYDQHTLLFSPTFASDQVILAASAADLGAYRSTNGGATWSPVGWYDPAQPGLGGFVGGSVFALALAPNTSTDAAAFAGTSSGLYRSSNRGDNWYQGNTGMPRLTVRSIEVAPGDPNTLLAGTSFFEHVNSYTPIEIDGNLQLSIDGGRTWRDVSGRLDRVQRVAFSPNFATDRTAFACAGYTGQHGFASGGVYRSTDGGQNWVKVLANGVCRSLAASPNFAVDHTLWAYVSGSGVLVSTDSGDTWTPLSGSPLAQVLEPSPNYALDQTLFGGTYSQGLQKSIDGGQHWTQVLSYTVSALAVSPAYGASRTLYAAVEESSGAADEMYRSTDGGATWQKLSTGIPPTWNAQAMDVAALSFASDGSVLVGVSYGFYASGGAAYRSVDGGVAWQLIADGLTSYAMFDLGSAPGRWTSMGQAAFSIYAGTSGGLWQIDVPQGDPSEPGAWHSNGPRGGRAQALAVSPNFVHDSVAFAGEWLMGKGGGQSGLGIFQSSDGGQTWRASSAGTEIAPYPSYATAVHAYALSPNFASDRTVFAATWGGLFKSIDGGAHWQWLSGAYFGALGSMESVALAPNYATSGHILAGGGWGGVYLSRDGGLTWSANYSLTLVEAIAYSPGFASDDTTFAGGTSGVHKTIDGGTSWTPVMTRPMSALAVSPQFGADHTLFAGGDAVYTSSNGGTSWISATIAPSVTRVSALALSPAFATDHALFAGTDRGLYRSDDSGGHWSPVSGYPDLPALSLAISPDWPLHSVLLVGTVQGVYRTTDGGVTWTSAQGLTALSTSALTFAPDESLMLAGVSNHGVYASGDASGTWSPIGLQDGSWYYDIQDAAISPNYASDRTMFAARSSGVSIGASIYRTRDGGATWQIVHSTDSVPSLAISPQYASDRTIYAAGSSGHVLRSVNGGDVWGEVGTWPAGSLNPAWWVALPPNYPLDGTVFAAGYQGFWRLPPGGTAWQPAASGLLSNTAVSALAVSPNYTSSQTLLAVASWDAGLVRPYRVFRSSDGGVNWQPSGIGLPDVKLNGVTFSPNYATDWIAYAISENELFRSIDGGQRWTGIGSPPGRPSLRDVVVNRAGQVLVTSSAGVWRYSTGFHNLIVDGDFEAGSGWDMPDTARPAGYASRIAFDGRQSLRVGIDDGNNDFAYSSARQTVTIPISSSHAVLSFRLYPVSSESTLAAQNQRAPLDVTPSRSDAGDAQYVLILNSANGVISQTLLWQLSNAQAWQGHVFDLAPYAGQAILLHFGVLNDGAGGSTGLYVDDVPLVVIGPLPHRLYLPVILRGYPGD